MSLLEDALDALLEAIGHLEATSDLGDVGQAELALRDLDRAVRETGFIPKPMW